MELVTGEKKVAVLVRILVAVVVGLVKGLLVRICDALAPGDELIVPTLNDIPS
jgi:hypothetical protein